MLSATARYASGFFTGIIGLVCAEIVAWGVLVAPPYAQAYQEFRTSLPTITRLALSSAWLFGLVAALAAAALALNLSWRWSERSRSIALAVLAALAVGLAIGTAFAGVYPFVQLSGNIAAE